LRQRVLATFMHLLTEMPGGGRWRLSLAALCTSGTKGQNFQCLKDVYSKWAQRAPCGRKTTATERQVLQGISSRSEKVLDGGKDEPWKGKNDDPWRRTIPDAHQKKVKEKVVPHRPDLELMASIAGDPSLLADVKLPDFD